LVSLSLCTLLAWPESTFSVFFFLKSQPCFPHASSLVVRCRTHDTDICRWDVFLPFPFSGRRETDSPGGCDPKRLFPTFLVFPSRLFFLSFLSSFLYFSSFFLFLFLNDRYRKSPGFRADGLRCFDSCERLFWLSSTLISFVIFSSS